MPIYLDQKKVELLTQQVNKIIACRNEALRLTSIDLLDGTDAISSIAIFNIVSQYDPHYNVNFARNGEDAKSNDIPIELKCSRVAGPLTRTGKNRKNFGRDAIFLFHALGDIDHLRYIFAARNKINLQILRIYDVSKSENLSIILNHLIQEKNSYIERGKTDEKKLKRDAISVTEVFLQQRLKFTSKNIIDGCIVYRDSV